VMEGGTTAGRDVNFGDISGQFAMGKNIKQNQIITKTITVSSEDKKDLHDTLLQFQKEIAKLNLPAEEAASVNSEVSLAVKETEKEQPDTKKIQNRVQGAFNTIKEVGDTIETVSNWDWTKKILKTLSKIGLSILL
jgi:hypothetical protein